MNEFIEQFLLEARELSAQASSDLLALERTPGDAGLLNNVFRAFHTLKGAAGIVDFAAMARALHAVEDVLARARAASQPLPGEDIDKCLASLDQVDAWLDAMEAIGDLPPHADARADDIVRLFAPGEHVAAEPRNASGDWAPDFLERHPAHARRARVALRYRPPADCFYRHEDPVDWLAGAPGLLAMELAPAAPWPPLARMDPFACNVVATALLAASPQQVQDFVAGRDSDVELHVIAGPPAGWPARAFDVLEVQRTILQQTAGPGAAGRLGAVGRVAASVLRGAGEAALAQAVEDAAAASIASLDPAPLSQAIDQAVQRAGAQPSSDEAPPAARANAPEEPVSRTLRVDVARIDALVALAGEIAVAKNALGHAALLARDPHRASALPAMLKEQHASLDRLVRDLQDAVVSIRVLPLRHVFQRFPRLVRDMAASLGKSVRLVVEGEATEADKTIVEALFEPLLHVLRNALDHGVEPPAERAARNKPAQATLRLRASRVGESVVVEAADDGRGLDGARIRAAAAARGLGSPETLAAMPDREAMDLIFAPGFSTAASVTDVSGRGVGMDSVRTAVERLGGVVTLESVPGEGTTVRFTLPYSVIMTRLMLVEAHGQTFGVPFDSIIETVRARRADIAPLGGERAIVLRGKTVPIIDLAGLLGQAGAPAGDEDANLVVATMNGQSVAFEVERFGGRMDLMLKPAEGLLACVKGVAGATLMGDGRVLIVLDMEGLLA
ncbi:MAG: uncharacterized protein JWN93_2334 [Hyphomicrobiales bacterium]|nr:uncharacterized protein [Hyphomicrobiales bacterium]